MVFGHGRETEEELGPYSSLLYRGRAMISSGIFVLSGFLACVGRVYGAELTTAMPYAGGDYFVITRSMGPAVGTIAGILTWFSLSLKSVFALAGMAAFVRVVTVPTMPDIVMQGIAVGLALVFVLINRQSIATIFCRMKERQRPFFRGPEPTTRLQPETRLSANLEK